jgi:hypothetical protein
MTAHADRGSNFKTQHVLDETITLILDSYSGQNISVWIRFWCKNPNYGADFACCPARWGTDFVPNSIILVFEYGTIFRCCGGDALSHARRWNLKWWLGTASWLSYEFCWCPMNVKNKVKKMHGFSIWSCKTMPWTKHKAQKFEMDNALYMAQIQYNNKYKARVAGRRHKPFSGLSTRSKEDWYINGWHASLVKGRIMSQLRARDVIFDGVDVVIVTVIMIETSPSYKIYKGSFAHL